MATDDIGKTLLKIVRILDKGIIMERNARDFYAGASRRTKNRKAKKMFDWLAQFEVGHKARLEAKRKQILSHKSLKGIKPTAVEEYKVSEADPWVKIPEGISEIEILKLALKNEKKAYSFFQKKITFSEDETLKVFFTQLAEEEEKHCRIIEDQLRHLKMNHIWQDFEEFEN